MLIQIWDKEWNIGCVNAVSWLILATGHEFTQPWVHLIAQLCTPRQAETGSQAEERGGLEGHMTHDICTLNMWHIFTSMALLFY